MLYVAKKPLPLRIDEDLLRRVDEARGDVSRTRWVERALEAALGEPTSVHIEGFGSVPADAKQTIEHARAAGRKLTPSKPMGKGLVPPRPKGT